MERATADGLMRSAREDAALPRRQQLQAKFYSGCKLLYRLRDLWPFAVLSVLTCSFWRQVKTFFV